MAELRNGTKVVVLMKNIRWGYDQPLDYSTVGTAIDSSLSDKTNYSEKRIRIYKVLGENGEEFLKDKEDKESLKDAAIFNTWKKAFISMINNKK